MSERPAPVRRGIATNVTLDTDAKAVLEHYAPAKTQGRFLSRLLYEYHADRRNGTASRTNSRRCSGMSKGQTRARPGWDAQAVPSTRAA